MANKGTFKKGEKRPNQGKRGPSKVTRELREMILTALDNAGGVEYLTLQANENPKAFMSLLGRAVPMEVGGNLGITLAQLVESANTNGSRG